VPAKYAKKAKAAAVEVAKLVKLEAKADPDSDAWVNAMTDSLDRLHGLYPNVSFGWDDGLHVALLSDVHLPTCIEHFAHSIKLFQADGTSVMRKDRRSKFCPTVYERVPLDV
jgi:hypothetical protein